MKEEVRHVYKKVYRSPSKEELYSMALRQLGLEYAGSERFQMLCLLRMKHLRIQASSPIISVETYQRLVNKTKDVILSKMAEQAMKHMEGNDE